MCFEDVMSQFHRLLAVQFPLLAGQHESHESMASPGFKKREKKEHRVRAGNNEADEERS